MSDATETVKRRIAEELKRTHQQYVPPKPCRVELKLRDGRAWIDAAAEPVFLHHGALLIHLQNEESYAVYAAGEWSSYAVKPPVTE